MVETHNPKITCIISIYNVEKYLNECLDSVINQTFRDIEIICINDGSTDNSLKILRKYGELDNRIKIHNQKNSGLSASRNRGIRLSKGECIAFLDGDDVLPLNAYELLYAELNDDVDLVMGDMCRFDSKGTYVSGLHQYLFKKTIKNTNLKRTPELIYNTTSTNMLFKRIIITNNDLYFPESMLYEDIPFTFKAIFNTTNITILNEITYYWRLREINDKPSISQQRLKVENFKDRLKAIKMVDQLYEEYGIDDYELIYNKNFKWVNFDFKLFINKFDEADANYIKSVVPLINEYLENVPSEIFSNLKLFDKIKYKCIRKNHVKLAVIALKIEKKLLNVKNVITS